MNLLFQSLVVASSLTVAVGGVVCSASAQTALPAAPKELDYAQGAPVPAGYHLESRKSKSMIVGGAATLGGLWLASVVAGAAEQSVVRFDTGSACFYAATAGSTCPSKPDYRPMYIPLAGPFITLSTAHAKGGGIAALAVLGVGQVGGLALLIAGLASNGEKLVRNDAGAPTPKLMPIVGLGSLGIAGTF